MCALEWPESIVEISKNVPVCSSLLLSGILTGSREGYPEVRRSLDPGGCMPAGFCADLIRERAKVPRCYSFQGLGENGKKTLCRGGLTVLTLEVSVRPSNRGLTPPR